MDFFQIKQLIKNSNILKLHFFGIFNQSQLNQLYSFRDKLDFDFYIIFLKNEFSKMGHYVLICKYQKDLIFIDSFGRAPSDYKLPKNNWLFSNKQVQSENSCLCAGYLLLTMMHAINRRISPLDAITQLFSIKNLKANDKIVFTFISKHLDLSEKERQFLKCIY